MLRTILFLLTFVASAAAVAAPCTSLSCTEWVNLGAGPTRSLVYRSYPLTTKNEAITRAFVLIHGATRDADNYFRTAVAAGFLADALNNTIIIAPRFAAKNSGCNDSLDANEINWPCSGNSWRAGGIATNNEKLTSFDLMDELLRKLANKTVFPNLKAIVISGHSAGGQYVTRYQMANQVHDSLGVPVTYIVSNPSSYAYLDNTRPNGTGDDFRTFNDARNCTTYDQWPYGLQNRTGYTAKLSDETLKKQLAARSVVYLLGELDTTPLAGFDGSCPAMAQGANRLLRGQAFAKYVQQKFGAKHQVTTVPLCGHNARCIFTAEVTLPLIFPSQAQKP
ncbi:MAG TPA: alpha/beta fold hydrolase [Blastocatellia bacterium]|nr:alpha/beta fold hydrolase [Blastocatellia bacterium]